MKYLKILGFAAVAAMAFMAFAGSASATVLCKANESTCSAANTYASGTTIHAVSTGPGANGKAVLESGSIILDECNSTVQGTTSTVSGTPLKGSVSALSWTNCTVPTTTLATGELGIEATSGGNGSLTGYGQQVTVSTGAFGTCTFGTASTGTTLGTVTGGNPAKLTVSTSVPLIKNESGLCPSSATWTASYEVDSPKPLFITK